jgi:hypothetical protein
MRMVRFNASDLFYRSDLDVLLVYVKPLAAFLDAKSTHNQHTNPCTPLLRTPTHTRLLFSPLPPFYFGARPRFLWRFLLARACVCYNPFGVPARMGGSSLWRERERDSIFFTPLLWSPYTCSTYFGPKTTVSSSLACSCRQPPLGFPLLSMNKAAILCFYFSLVIFFFSPSPRPLFPLTSPPCLLLFLVPASFAGQENGI